VIRETNRKLTGLPTRNFEVVLGLREDGTPGITLHAAYYGRSHACFDDPLVVRELIADLQAGLAHLEGSIG
jgi:hypothetical protein